MNDNFLANLEELEKKIAGELKQSSAKKTEVKSVGDNKVSEKDILFDKTYKCPVCETVFKSKTIKTGKKSFDVY
jgi:hypothetical protein